MVAFRRLPAFFYAILPRSQSQLPIPAGETRDSPARPNLPLSLHSPPLSGRDQQQRVPPYVSNLQSVIDTVFCLNLTRSCWNETAETNEQQAGWPRKMECCGMLNQLHYRIANAGRNEKRRRKKILQTIPGDAVLHEISLACPAEGKLVHQRQALTPIKLYPAETLL